MNSLIRFFAFTPSITFGLISAEIAPWALIYSFILRSLKNKLIIFIFFFAILHAITIQFIYGNFDFIIWLTVWLSYLNVLLVFYAIIQSNITIAFKLLVATKIIFYFLIIVGLLQYFSLLGPLEDILKLLIPRGEVSQIGSGRGVTLLSTEPSRASIELVFLFSVIRLCIYKKHIGIHKFFIDLVFFIYISLILKSISGVLCLVIFFFALSKIYRYAFFVIFLIILLTTISYDSRFLQLLFSLMSSNSILEAWNILMNVSGFRFSSVLSAYYSIFDSIIGYGAGNYNYSSIKAMEFLGLDPNSVAFFRNRGGDLLSVRPTSFFSNIVLDFGIFGLFFLVYFFHYIIKISSSSIYPALIAFFFVIILNGSVGNPVPWICIAVLIKIKCSNTSTMIL